MNIKYNFYYWGPLLFRTEILEHDLKEIKKLCKKNSKKSFVKKLAGHIKDEYTIDEKKVNTILKPYTTVFREAFLNWYNKPVQEILAKEAWVNYMKPGDFNPVHTHGGCDFASVIYLDVPKKLEKEIKEYQGTGNYPGGTTFLYGENGDFFNSWYFFKPEPGSMFIFPWNLKHFVDPFRSKCERISVAVNFIEKGGRNDTKNKHTNI